MSDEPPVLSITVNWFVLALHITIFALYTRSDIPSHQYSQQICTKYDK